MEQCATIIKWPLLLIFFFSIGIAPLPLVKATAAEEPILIAEIRDANSTYASGTSVPVAMTFYLGGGLIDNCTDWPCLEHKIGGDVFPNGTTGVSVDYTPETSSECSVIIDWVTDGWNGALAIGERALDSDGNLTSPGQVGIGMEEDMFDGINSPPDLAGCEIKLIRLVVNKVSVTQGNMAEWDVTWQFWGGGIQPATSGGGQRSDVDDFLLFASPMTKTTALPLGTESFKVHIFYKTSIDKSTFSATLNGVPFSGFNPMPGTSETVSIPLSSGRNALILEVSGTSSDGRKANDRDRLTFIVK